MLKRIKLTFVGGDISEKSKLLEKLQQLKYEGNFFTFFTKYQTLMTQVSVRGSGITDTLIMQFLMKLPASLNSVIYPHMKSLEEASTRDTNYNILWNTIYEDLLNFLISCGWFKPNMTSKKKNTIMNDNFAMQVNNKCWKCGQEGHFRKDCPKKVKKQSWMVKSSSSITNILLDSGASQHICGELDLFESLEDIEPEEVVTANGILVFSKVGNIHIELDNGLEVELKNVAYWKNAPFLLSVGKLVEKGLNIDFTSNSAIISSQNDTLYVAKKVDMVYHICMKSKPQKPKKVVMLSTRVWHSRLGHCGQEKFKLTLPKQEGIDNFYKNNCVGCLTGKTHRLPIPKKNPAKNSYAPLNILVGDCVGPYPQSTNKKRGALIVGDYETQFLWVEPFYKKSEVPELLIALVKRLLTKFPGKISEFRSDNGTEFKNKKLDRFFKDLGIEQRFSIPYVHEMNGKAENNNRILIEGSRAMLITSQLSKGYWSYAIQTMAHVYNRTVLPKYKKTPWELLFGYPPTIEHLRVFGVVGYAHISRETRSKLDPTAYPARFLGYASDSIGYIVEDLQSKRVTYTRSFFCNEENFLAPESPMLLGSTGQYVDPSTLTTSLTTDNNLLFEVEENIPSDFEYIETDNIEEEHIENIDTDSTNNNIEAFPPLVGENTDTLQSNSITTEENLTEEELSLDQEAEDISNSPVDNEEEVSSNPPNTEDPIYWEVSKENIIGEGRTRSAYASIVEELSNKVQQFKLAFNVELKKALSAKGYHSYKEAVSSNANWEEAYLKEIRKLEEKGQLKVVNKEKFMKPIPFIEVLTEKFDNVLGQTKLKVRLAARGDLQANKPSDCYSPSVGASEMRLFIIVAKSLGLYLLQGDCPAAYLNGRLKEPVYLYLPEGHPQNDGTNKLVYECPASIYGLCISGKVWY